MLQSEAPTHTCTQSGRDISVPTPGMTSLPVLATHSRAFGVCVCVFPPPLAFCPLYLISPLRQPVFQFYPDRFCVPTGALAVIKKLKCTSLQNKKKSLGRRRRGLFLLVLRFLFSLPLILISCCTFLNLTHFGGGAFLQPRGLARCYSS